MFHLQAPTTDAWIEKVSSHLDELLLEQAHLEKKAASGALTLMFRYPEHAFMHQGLSELAREELEHFEQTLTLLEKRQIEYRRQKPSPYAGRLLACVRETEPEKLVDQLLCNAVIEARSCERMQALGQALAGADPELSSFYLGLVHSEARHHGLYLDYASRIYGTETSRSRLQEILEHEGTIIQTSTELPRLHN